MGIFCSTFASTFDGGRSVRMTKMVKLSINNILWNFWENTNNHMWQ